MSSRNDGAARAAGCDGLHSATRETRAASASRATTSPNRGRSSTPRCDGWTEAYDVTFVYLDAIPVILTALPGRRWRGLPAAELAGFGPRRRRGRRPSAATLPAVSFVDVENPTRFHCHTKVATRFRSGRVLLAGDAAHVCSPAEGHGMNTGLQDAFNLAWKLALVHHGAAEPEPLDSYEAERRPVGRGSVGRRGRRVRARPDGLTDPTERDRPRPGAAGDVRRSRRRATTRSSPRPS